MENLELTAIGVLGMFEICGVKVVFIVRVSSCNSERFSGF